MKRGKKRKKESGKWKAIDWADKHVEDSMEKKEGGQISNLSDSAYIIVINIMNIMHALPIPIAFTFF